MVRQNFLQDCCNIIVEKCVCNNFLFSYKNFSSLMYRYLHRRVIHRPLHVGIQDRNSNMRLCKVPQKYT